jgi:hypothetical protein
MHRGRDKTWVDGGVWHLGTLVKILRRIHSRAEHDPRRCHKRECPECHLAHREPERPGDAEWWQ